MTSAAPEARTRAPAAAAQNVTLKVIVTGRNGEVTVSGQDDCSTETTQDSQDSCQYSVGQGQDVTLRPVNADGFVGWSVFDCPDKGACTVKMDSNRTVVATFTPTSLTVVVEGQIDGSDDDGRVTTTDGKIDCSGRSRTCSNSQFVAFAEVTLKAEPEAELERWSGACQEADTSPTCTLFLSGDDVAGAKFKDDPTKPNIIPPRQQAELTVVVEPRGAGRVTSDRSRLSEAINCSPTCSAKFEQSERPRLTAEPAERFVQWRGLGPYCTTNPTCRYPGFRGTTIQAVFQAAAPPPPPPPPPPPSTQTTQSSPPPTVPGPCENRRVGTNRADRLDGGPGGDAIQGRGGNDRIRGLDGNDCLNGGGGNDSINGGKGADKVTGGTGSDTLLGGPGKDVITGGPGSDQIVAVDGVRDTISCGAGRDVVRADRADRVSGCERGRRDLN